MRFLIQRVSHASVRVEDRLEAEIDGGLLVLIGIAAADSTREADYLIEKLVNLRIFADENGKMKRSALDLNAQLLLIFSIHSLRRL